MRFFLHVKNVNKILIRNYFFYKNIIKLILKLFKIIKITNNTSAMNS